MSPDLLLARRDLAFLLHEWLDVAALCARERYAEHSRDTFDAVLDLSAELAAAQFAPHNALSDAQEPQFDGETVTIVPEVGAAVRAFAEAGLVSAAMDESIGGGQLPHVVQQACFAWFQAANVSTSGYPMLTMANANLLLAHASPEQVARLVPPMLDGRWFGTMCLSEPQAGSSLADVATRAVRQPDGTFRLFGNKMWISGGDHELGENIVHLVLARVEGAPPGVKGLSLFATPKYVVTRPAIGASATTSPWPGSTTRWASAAPSTRCSTSARAGTSRAVRPAPSANSSARRAAASRSCST